jgi:serine/threonine protein kinase
MTDYAGQQLGNYRLTRLLGQGGFADVYLGEHLYLKTQAAIKMIHTEMSPDDREAFRTEAQMIATLKHPHIVRVLEFGVENTTPYLVMDYAANGTLRQHHPKGSILPATTILLYVRQVAAALQYAHAQRLIHQDVKPENMLVEDNGNILLSDFGIAVIAHNTASMKAQKSSGTPRYMSPEQYEGMPRPASDQYSLGVVVYEWLSGACPFQGNLFSLAYQHKLALPPAFKEDLHISSSVEEVVRKALAKEPEQRFPNIEAFANALEQAIQPPAPPPAIFSAYSENSLTIPARPSSPLAPAPDKEPPTLLPPKPAPGPRVSRRIVVSALTGMALAGGVAGGGWWWTITHTPTTSSTKRQATPSPSPHVNAVTPGTTSTTTDTTSNTPGTTAINPGTVLYQADLSKPNNIYKEWQGDILSGGIGWKISNGTLLSSGDSTDEAIWVQASLPTANYAIETQVQVLVLPDGKSYSAPAFGLFLRGQPTGQMGYLVEISGLFVLDTAMLSSASFTGTTNKDEAHYQMDTKLHTYRAEITGDTIRLLIDSITIFEDTDKNNLFSSSGQVGLMTSLLQVKVIGFKVVAL